MKIAQVAASLALAGLTSVALAAPTITTGDGPRSPFGGFDWADGSAAYSNDLNIAGAVAGQNFNITYAGWARGLNCSSGSSCTSLSTPGLDNNANGVDAGYEYTMYLTLNGTIDQVIDLTPLNLLDEVFLITYTINFGNFDIFYDTAANAHAVAGGNWTGFQDGINIISGTFLPGLGTFSTFLGTNSISLSGVVSNTNNLYVNPDLVGTLIPSTLQLFGFDQTSFNAPTAIQGTAIAPTGVLFQADANQTFTARVPEPTGLALVGLALAGLAGVGRRRRA